MNFQTCTAAVTVFVFFKWHLSQLCVGGDVATNMVYADLCECLSRSSLHRHTSPPLLLVHRHLCRLRPTRRRPPSRVTTARITLRYACFKHTCQFIIFLNTTDTNNTPSVLWCVVHRVFLCQTAVNATTAELLKKQEELEKKARELERRERELESHSLGPGACKRWKWEAVGVSMVEPHDFPFKTDYTHYDKNSIQHKG